MFMYQLHTNFVTFTIENDFFIYNYFVHININGVARAFLRERLAHPEGQNEEEKLEKFEEKLGKFIEIWGKNKESGGLAHQGLWGWLRPWLI